eukprot:gb/GECH01009166.1/.p1 GENE.gb/GECH01009166.1/~~gb/GECH01009166.1/.p1  ORF type:complete len:872 (+),score=222.74 gb/GECH01009166.1/:1-2616(+)
MENILINNEKRSREKNIIDLDEQEPKKKKIKVTGDWLNSNNYFERALHFLETGEFSDFILLVNEEKFNVHRVYLTQESEYFQQLVTGAFNETQEQKASIQIECQDCFQVFPKLLEYMYTYQICIEQEKEAISLMALADRFMLPSLIQNVALYIEDRIQNSDISFDIIVAAIEHRFEYACQELRTLVKRVCDSLADSFLAFSFDDLLKLPFSALKEILSSDCLRVFSENQVYRFVKTAVHRIQSCQSSKHDSIHCESEENKTQNDENEILDLTKNDRFQSKKGKQLKKSMNRQKGKLEIPTTKNSESNINLEDSIHPSLIQEDVIPQLWKCVRFHHLSSDFLEEIVHSQEIPYRHLMQCLWGRICIDENLGNEYTKQIRRDCNKFGILSTIFHATKRNEICSKFLNITCDQVNSNCVQLTSSQQLEQLISHSNKKPISRTTITKNYSANIPINFGTNLLDDKNGLSIVFPHHLVSIRQISFFIRGPSNLSVPIFCGRERQGPGSLYLGQFYPNPSTQHICVRPQSIYKAKRIHMSFQSPISLIGRREDFHSVQVYGLEVYGMCYQSDGITPISECEFLSSSFYSSNMNSSSRNNFTGLNNNVNNNNTQYSVTSEERIFSEIQKALINQEQENYSKAIHHYQNARDLFSQFSHHEKLRHQYQSLEHRLHILETIRDSHSPSNTDQSASNFVPCALASAVDVTIDPRVHLNPDVIGQQHVKEHFWRQVILNLRLPLSSNRATQPFFSETLLYGPRGAGKSYLCEGVAHAGQAALVRVSIPKLISKACRAWNRNLSHDSHLNYNSDHINFDNDNLNEDKRIDHIVAMYFRVIFSDVVSRLSPLPMLIVMMDIDAAAVSNTQTILYHDDNDDNDAK